MIHDEFPCITPCCSLPTRLTPLPPCPPCPPAQVSFRNFLSQAVGALPLPAILRFNEDRTQRLALQQQVGLGGEEGRGAGAWRGPGRMEAQSGQRAKEKVTKKREKHREAELTGRGLACSSRCGTNAARQRRRHKGG